MSRKKTVCSCDMTKRDCEFAGSKHFNYGFMRGMEAACFHPKIDVRSRALFTFTGRPRFPCPVGLHTVEESTE